MKKHAIAAAAVLVAAVALGGTAAPVIADQSRSTEGKGNGSSATQPVTANTESGQVLGYTDNGVLTFKGIPYAQAERFEAPQKPEPWSGVRSSLKYGEVCPNGSDVVSPYEFITPSATNLPQNEDCLFTNVWTESTDPAARKPVVVWLHGGGFQSGSSNELAYYDGRNLAADGDVVYVSVNHRLNALGYMDLSAYGDKYANSGNAGIADLVAALQWVKDNITQFGGDPNNVTIMGQSGGAVKVTTLMGVPAAKGLFHKAVVQSGGSTGRPQQSAREQSAKVLEILGLDGSRVEELKNIPYEQLLAAAEQAGFRSGPVVDGSFYPQTTVSAEGKFSDISKDVPMIVGFTLGEFASNVGPLSQGQLGDAYRPNVSEERARELLQARYGERTDAIVAAYKNAYPTHDLYDLLHISSPGGRNTSIADAKAAQNGAPVFMSVYAWNLPFFGGVTSYHTGGDLPFLLNNVDKIGYLVAGDDQGAEKLEREASSALVSFAHNGDPAKRSNVKWPAYTTKKGETIIFDRKTNVRERHDAELYRLLTEASPTGR